MPQSPQQTVKSDSNYKNYNIEILENTSPS